MPTNPTIRQVHAIGLIALATAASVPQPVKAQVNPPIVASDQHALSGVSDELRAFLSANRGDNGGGDQSLQGGDVLYGTSQADVLVGALGVDVLFGNDGDDVLIGGTEDFNPFNRDRGFGNAGDDVFVWAPGDGNDFFDGGNGDDVLMIGLLGEQRDSNGSDTGAPFFNVNPPSAAGSQDFDGIFIDATYGLPVVDVAGGPGFCEVVDGSATSDELALLLGLRLDHLVRFTLRGPAADNTNPDTGLRIAVHLTNTEFLVCGSDVAGEIVILDLTTVPPTPTEISALPLHAQYLMQN